MIVIIGNARSGTSWLGKIFDSHPQIVYRHEPDTSRPCFRFPFFIEGTDQDEYLAPAFEYLTELCDTRTIRSVGRRPHFDKSYRSTGSKALHVGLVSLLQVLGKVPGLGSKARKLNVPDFFGGERTIEYAIKSVVSLGRAGLYSRVLNDSGHIVYLIRHPCGVIASQLRGISLGKLKFDIPLQTICNSAIGRHYDLSVERLKRLSEAEMLTWSWVVMNEQAMSGLKDRPNAILVTHESLCADPLADASRLFEFCGLSWSAQTEDFLHGRFTGRRTRSYFDVKRDSRNEIDKWKSELDNRTIKNIESILEKSPLREIIYSKPAEMTA